MKTLHCPCCKRETPHIKRSYGVGGHHNGFVERAFFGICTLGISEAALDKYWTCSYCGTENYRRD